MKILIPIDNSQCSWNVMNSLSERTWPKDVEFRIVTVIPFITNLLYARGVPKTRRMIKDYAQQVVDGMVIEFKKVIGHASINGKVLVGGVTSSIVQEAAVWKPDLIVMESDGNKGFFQRLIFGSISEDVSKQVTCKVEIVRGSEEQNSSTY